MAYDEHLATAERDTLTAALADATRHDCARWSDEGIGCAICNPSAITCREAWANDPIRLERDALRGAITAAREALEDLQRASDSGDCGRSLEDITAKLRAALTEPPAQAHHA